MACSKNHLRVWPLLAALCSSAVPAWSLPSECSNDALRILYPSLVLWCEQLRPVEAEMGPLLAEIEKQKNSVLDANNLILGLNAKIADIVSSNSGALETYDAIARQLGPMRLTYQTLKLSEDTLRSQLAWAQQSLDNLKETNSRQERDLKRLVSDETRRALVEVVDFSVEQLERVGMGKIVLFSMDTDANFAWNPKTGLGWGRIDLPWHVSLSSEQIEAALHGVIPDPHVDFIAAAINSVGIKVSYGDGYTEWVRKEGGASASRFVSSKRFVDWMGLDQAADKAVAAVLTAGATSKGDLQEAAEMIRLELADMYSWMEEVGIDQFNESHMISSVIGEVQSAIDSRNFSEIFDPSGVSDMMTLIDVPENGGIVSHQIEYKGNFQGAVYNLEVALDVGPLNDIIKPVAKQLLSARDISASLQIPHLAFSIEIPMFAKDKTRDQLVNDWVDRLKSGPDIDLHKIMDGMISDDEALSPLYKYILDINQRSIDLSKKLDDIIFNVGDIQDLYADLKNGDLAGGAVSFVGTEFSNHLADMASRFSIGGAGAQVEEATINLYSGLVYSRVKIHHKVTLENAAELIRRLTELAVSGQGDIDRAQQVLAGSVVNPFEISSLALRELVAEHQATLAALDTATAQIGQITHQLDQIVASEQKLRDQMDPVRASLRIARIQKDATDQAVASVQKSIAEVAKKVSEVYPVYVANIARYNYLVGWWGRHNIEMPNIGGMGHGGVKIPEVGVDIHW